MDFFQLELETGIRMTLQKIPNCQTSLEATSIPLAVHLTPAKRIDSVPISYEVANKCVCGSYLNPGAVVNYSTKTWFCNFCLRSNKLTPNSAKIVQPNTPLPEQEPKSVVFDYKVQDSTLNLSFSKMNYVFLVDTCLNSENFVALKRSLAEAAELIDFDHSMVVLIHYSRNVNVMKNSAKLAFSQSICLPSYYTQPQVLEALNLQSDFQKFAKENFHTMSRIAFTDKECLINAIELIEEDPFPYDEKERNSRASGKAIEYALDIIRHCMIDSPRILLFIGGPCTISSGRVADTKISEFIRKHLDLETKPDIKTQIEGIKKYYTDLALRAVQLKTTIDIFAFSLIEFGLYEMENLVSQTNGTIVMNEEFKQSHFDVAIKQYFKRDEHGSTIFGSNAEVTLHLSKEFKINGCIGNCFSQNTKPKNQSDNPIGQANTNRWFIGGIDQESTIMFILELAEKERNKGYSKYTKGHIQFVLTYKHPKYGLMTRVITIDRQFVPVENPVEILPEIDQFCVIATYARLAAFKVFDYDNTTLIRYLDKNLISILKTYQCGTQIREELNLIAQYFYYLRKSNFVKKFASSLDEMTFYKHTVLREPVENVLIIVQPQIIEYSLNSEEPKSVAPDLGCLKKDVILLVDTFFNVVIWKGATIKSWIDEGYHLQDEYAHLAEMIKLPEEDCNTICEDRTVRPCKIEAFSGSPMERFLKSRLNPETTTPNLQKNIAEDDGNFITEDASLSVFMNRLVEYLKEGKN